LALGVPPDPRAKCGRSVKRDRYWQSALIGGVGKRPRVRAVTFTRPPEVRESAAFTKSRNRGPGSLRMTALWPTTRRTAVLCITGTRSPAVPSVTGSLQGRRLVVACVWMVNILSVRAGGWLSTK
jgi:hypothetical protein